MPRYAITSSGTVQIAAGGGGRSSSRSFGIVCASGTLLLERSATGSAPDMSSAARIDFSLIPGVSYTCQSGVSLWATVSAGTLNVDVLQGGEQ